MRVGNVVAALLRLGEQLHGPERRQVEVDVGFRLPVAERALVVLAAGQHVVDRLEMLLHLRAALALLHGVVRDERGKRLADELFRAAVFIVLEIIAQPALKSPAARSRR